MIRAFEVTGKMSVRGKPIKDVLGNIVGYKLKDGTIVKLVVALDVQRSARPCSNLPYTIANSNDIRELGFDLLEYDQVKFKEVMKKLTLDLYAISDLLEPFLPETSEKIKKALETKKVEPLFQRIK